MRVRNTSLSEDQIHRLLGNSRRSATLRQLGENGGTVSLRELSERVAALETGETPPPSNVRESVYNSLHQTHLPQLEEVGVVEYDRDRRQVRLCKHAREVDLYMEVVTQYGVTWSEIYRALGVSGLLVVLGALLEAPLLGGVDPLLWTSLFLALFALLSLYQLWANRSLVLSGFRE
ncbi:hypothetical protein QA600_07515 [Natronococcus sp. A-GB1]|uniref:DUF7344 domain-containing protein n=1 Tax=Natronococcus sp. A-GB1 TaxID=3037648 RepID=UPI00241D2847|nr:hypothetical protein [Natronococcus sp. A-GB1]MDG5759188.1 hypothetical protein [Natronococcus sp. A-GB1]